MVIKKHMDFLKSEGNIIYVIESMNYPFNNKWKELNSKDDINYDILRINSEQPNEKIKLLIHFDRYVATFWSSVDMVDEYKYMNPGSKKLYLIQSMEAGFYALNDKTRLSVFATYRNYRLEPIC